MGLMSRSVSIMRYRVKGEVEGSFWDAIEAGRRDSLPWKPVETVSIINGMLYLIDPGLARVWDRIAFFSCTLLLKFRLFCCVA
jgi:hypothetical protein